LTELQYPPHDGSAVFTDPEIPECEPSTIQTLLYTGTIEEEQVSGKLTPAGTFTLTSVDGITAENGSIVELVLLSWEEAVVQGSTIPLTGGYLRLPDDY